MNCTPLMTGVQSRNQALCRLLIENHASAGHADARGFTSLHRAAEMGETELVELLLTAGAAPYPEAEEGHTPLSLATSPSSHASSAKTYDFDPHEAMD